MKKRRFVCFADILLILVLAGCAGRTAEMPLNRDGTIGSVAWGMSREEVGTALGAEVTQMKNGDLLLENCGILGTYTTVRFSFGTDGLGIIRIFFHPGTDMTAEKERISSVFGTELRGNQGRPFWHAAQSLDDVLNDAGKAAARALATADDPRKAAPDDEEYARWLSAQWLFIAELVDTDSGGQELFISGRSTLQARTLNERFGDEP